jgi:hypothetical protein
MTEGIKKRLALAKHLEQPYFEAGGKYYEGDKETLREKYEKYLTSYPSLPLDFEGFLEHNYAYSEMDEIGNDEYHTNGRDYLVLTDEEATERAETEIDNSLWAFRASFIISVCGLDYELEKMIQAFQEKKCEDANDAIRSLINKCTKGNEFNEAAIAADGRGHFLSQYDGIEHEEEIDGETFYIYRTN